MSTVLLDSDVLIGVLRQRDPGIEAQWDRLGCSDTVILYSPVTAAEVWHGVRRSEQEAVEALFLVLTCAPIDDGIGRKAGEYRFDRIRRDLGYEPGVAIEEGLRRTLEWARG